ncbi:MAG: 50S ribosomal protein L6 [Candidatus Micrarchaeota archaeon]
MEIPDGIIIIITDGLVKIKGPNGEVEKRFKISESEITMDGNQLKIESRSKAIKKTLEAHIKNMINGVQHGYSRKFKLIYAHFPFTLEIKGNSINIKNLMGEKLPRTSKIIGKTKIDVKGQEVIISSPDKEALGQTIANFKRALRVRNKDCRIFQDGIYEI